MGLPMPGWGAEQKGGADLGEGQKNSEFRLEVLPSPSDWQISHLAISQSNPPSFEHKRQTALPA